LLQYAQDRDFNPVPHWGHQSNDDETFDWQFGQIACKVKTAADRVGSFANISATISGNNRLPIPLPHMIFSFLFRHHILTGKCKELIKKGAGLHRQKCLLAL
jgi:hypothetical protein